MGKWTHAGTLPTFRDTSGRDVAFTFTADLADNTFKCRLDVGATVGEPRDCDDGDAVYTGLSGGPHTFTVMTTDYLDDPGTPATRRFTVDATGPMVTVTNPEEGKLYGRDVLLIFDQNEPGRYVCSLDDGPDEDCDSHELVTGLADGIHKVEVYGIDQWGNSGERVTRTWTVDAIPPDTIITAPPAGRTTDRRIPIRFALVDPEADASFTCQLDDRAPVEDCTSPYKTPRLSLGRHTFSVYAIDRAGNRDEIPASRTYRVCQRRSGCS